MTLTSGRKCEKKRKARKNRRRTKKKKEIKKEIQSFSFSSFYFLVSRLTRFCFLLVCKHGTQTHIHILAPLHNPQHTIPHNPIQWDPVIENSTNLLLLGCTAKRKESGE